MTSPKTLALIRSAEELMEQMDREDRERMERLEANLRVLLAAIGRIREQVEFERGMTSQRQPCDSCWMLVELYDRLADLLAQRAVEEPAAPPSKKVAP